VASNKDRVLFWVVAGIMLFGVSLPYLIAQRAAGPDYIFSGFLMNPIDGHSYLAKMAQGAAGAWKFTLPYTAEPGDGAYFHFYYLTLGHLARLTGVSNLLIYHIARLSGAFFMLAALYRFVWAYLEEVSARRFAFVLAAFGSGLGWLAFPFGGFTADFWVAEAYPFLSGYSNPHFSLGLGLMLWILTRPKRAGAGEVVYLALALALGLVSPFGLFIALGVLGLLAGLARIGWVQASWALRRFTWILLGGGGVLLYDFLAIQQDTVLASWDLQNLTPSPGVFDLFLSFSPALAFALVGVWSFLRGLKGQDKKASLPSFWLILVLSLIYLPFNLQRRLLTGFYVPVAVLGARGVFTFAGSWKKWAGRLAAVILAMSVLTNVIVIFAGVLGAGSHNPLLYISRDEALAFTWINKSTSPDALILASPLTGLWIPSQTGRRVIYGHPFETVDAQLEKDAVEAVFRGIWTAGEVREFLQERGVNYIFFGPRERELGEPQGLDEFRVVFQGTEVQIYALQPNETGN
jgi:hypothetical protein